jgi:hypothetical protein
LASSTFVNLRHLIVYARLQARRQVKSWGWAKSGAIEEMGGFVAAEGGGGQLEGPWGRAVTATLGQQWLSEAGTT